MNIRSSPRLQAGNTPYDDMRIACGTLILFYFFDNFGDVLNLV